MTNKTAQPLVDNARTRLFTFLALLIPVVLLALLEAGLRLAHFGAEYDLVYRRTLAGEPYYVLNRHVARRYFSFSDVAIPDARDAVFRVHKRPNGLRIFCLGGSTTAGFPYTYNATFPSLLQDRLEALFPDGDVEVVNVGISAINSYSVLDFVHELVRYEPDAFVIYMGHNEFYGALGVASSQSFGKSRWLKLAFLRLEKLKVFQLVRWGVESFRKRWHREGERRDVTLMEEMARNKAIPLDSPDYRRALRDFRLNYRDILKTAAQHHVPVLVSTLVSNLRDQPPFVSLERPGLSPEQRAELSRLLKRSRQALSAENGERALSFATDAVAIDSTYADAWFALGKALWKNGQYRQAKRAFVRARDLDALRFRASSDFNKVVRNLAADLGISLVPMDSAFAAVSPHGVPGHELFLEHLHPNYDGYFLMAKAVCAALRNYGFFGGDSVWAGRVAPSDSLLRERAGVTALDLELAALRIERLTSHWPFNGRVRVAEPTQDPVVKRVAKEIYGGKLSWNQGHYDVASAYIQQGRYREAEAEYRAVIKVVPTNFYPYLKLGDLKLAQGKTDEARELYSTALVLSRGLPYAYAKLGTLLLMQDKATEALPLLQRAAALARKRADFNRESRGRLYYALAVALAKTGRVSDAVQAARKAAEWLPNDAGVQQLLQQLGAK